MRRFGVVLLALLLPVMPFILLTEGDAGATVESVSAVSTSYAAGALASYTLTFVGGTANTSYHIGISFPTGFSVSGATASGAGCTSTVLIDQTVSGTGCSNSANVPVTVTVVGVVNGATGTYSSSAADGSWSAYYGSTYYVFPQALVIGAANSEQLVVTAGNSLPQGLVAVAVGLVGVAVVVFGVSSAFRRLKGL